MPVAKDKSRSLMFLSLLCFALGDVRDGLGPFLGVFLQEKGWLPDEIGFAMTIGELAAICCITPIGALADWTRKKRLMLMAASAGIIAACGMVFYSTGTTVVWSSRILQAVLAAAIAPTLSGMTLGLVGQKNLPERLGKNEAWNHFGNCGTALLGGAVGYYHGIPGVFAVMAAMGVLAVISLKGINPNLINHAVARGLEPDRTEETVPARQLFRDFALLAVALTLFFFHLGNAAMLPLLGQSAVARFEANPAVYTAATVVIAQTTMIAVSLWGARLAVSRGYGMLFILALAVLPVRGLIACFYNSPWSLVPVQVLDGIGAGLMGVATPGIVARMLRGTGHVNMGLGVVLTAQGTGAALSSSYGGLFARHISYSAAFFALGLASCMGLGVFLMAARFLPGLRQAISSAEERLPH